MPWSKDNLPKNVKGMNLSDHQIDIFVSAANEALKEYGDEGKAIATGIAAAKHEIKHNDAIKGGLADNKSLQDIADKHSVNLSDIETEFKKGVKVEMEHTDSKEKAEEIAKDHLFEMADYYTKLDKMEKQNSKDWAKTYKASNFIEKGVCTYNNETIYLSQEALNKAIHTIKGRPVVIQHQKVTPDNMQEHAVGYVSGCGFDEYNASFYCDFVVFDDEGKEVIARDYSVSCAYLPKAFGKGGTWHNTPYDREVTELEFTHLALVPDPRYEDAKIYENSKNDDTTTKETYNMEKIEVEQGFLASLIALAQKPFLNAKEEKEECKKEKEEDDDKMEHEGEIYSKKELINAYKSKMNEMSKEKEDKKEEEHEKKETKKEEKEEHEEKKNSKDSDEDIEFFNSMQKVMAEAQTDANDKVEVYSQNKGLELGSKAFG